MLEAKFVGKNCTSSRNVVFLLNTGTPYSSITPTLRKLILADCKIDESGVSSFKPPIKINGRLI